MKRRPIRVRLRPGGGLNDEEILAARQPSRGDVADNAANSGARVLVEAKLLR